MNRQLLSAALGYAGHGWHVFPLIPGTKRPACPDHTADRCNHTDPWCRETHAGWEPRATTDLDRIRRAWTGRGYGIGIACGPSRLLVIDTDIHKGDDPIPDQWRRLHTRRGDTVLAHLTNLTKAGDRLLPVTHTVATPSGGTHRYYHAPDQPRLGNTAGKLGWLIDTRGHGGYVVAPPTQLADGRYTIHHQHPVAGLPVWLTDLLTTAHTAPQQPSRRSQSAVETAARPDAGGARSGYLAAALAGEAGHVRAAQQGQRNHALFCAAVALGQLVAGGQLDPTIVRAQLHDACADHIAAGAFTAAQADATISSGLSCGARQPRTRGGRNVA